MLRCLSRPSPALFRIVLLAAPTFLITACGAQLSQETESSPQQTESPHSVDLAWTASSSAYVAGYNVYRGASATGHFQKLNSDLVFETSYTDTSVQSGMTYYYTVTAVDSEGAESAYSNVALATVP
jgi:fibronectin type 3 domain-containing protein